MGRAIARLLAIVGLVGVWLAPRSAAAFCRTRLCDSPSSTVKCERDANKCATNTLPVYWPGPSVDFLVDARGSERRGISGQAALLTMERAFANWTAADCGPGSPTIALGGLSLESDESALQQALGTPGTDEPADQNVSVLTFVDDDWYPRSASAVAITTTTWGLQTARIRGTDIEVNSENRAVSLTGDGEYDLFSVLTHEVGHVLGLSDVNDPQTVMYYRYQARDAEHPLAVDDEQGACTIYPPDRFDKEGGGCACSVPRHGPAAETAWLSVTVMVLGFGFRRRSRGARN